LLRTASALDERGSEAEGSIRNTGYVAPFRCSWEPILLDRELMPRRLKSCPVTDHRLLHLMSQVCSGKVVHSLLALVPKHHVCFRCAAAWVVAWVASAGEGQQVGCAAVCRLPTENRTGPFGGNMNANDMVGISCLPQFQHAVGCGRPLDYVAVFRTLPLAPQHENREI
jgi:hypothetical protein